LHQQFPIGQLHKGLGGLQKRKEMDLLEKTLLGPLKKPQPFKRGGGGEKKKRGKNSLKPGENPPLGEKKGGPSGTHTPFGEGLPEKTGGALLGGKYTARKNSGAGENQRGAPRGPPPHHLFGPPVV